MQLDIYEYYKQIELPISIIFQQMSNRGISIDLPYIEKLKSQLESQFLPLDEEIKNKLGVENVNSDKQVIEALDKRFGLRFQLKGKPTRSKVALARMKGNEIVDLLLLHSELGTLLDTFVYKYLERGDSTAHCFFNQCGTRTGRLSCSNPNLLQIPKHTENGLLVRKMFVARGSMLLGDCDYSGIEPWCLAVLSKDPAMLQMFADGINFHDYFATHLGVERKIAKVFDLETYYGATEYGVAKTLSCTEAEAKEKIEQAWQLFPGLRRWRDKILYNARKSGYVETLYGRRIKFDNLDSPISWKREAAERRVMNNVTQGSASEIIKLGMINVSHDKRFHPQFGLLLQVYDQLVAESPTMKQDMYYMVEDMQMEGRFEIPLVVDYKMGANWADVR